MDGFFIAASIGGEITVLAKSELTVPRNEIIRPVSTVWLMNLVRWVFKLLGLGLVWKPPSI